MSMINSVSSSSNLNVQNTNEASSTGNQHKIHHHHHHNNSSSQDSIKISDDSKNGSNSIQTNPLDSLVANGTITQDQENSIKSAFLSARQSNQSGTYDSKPTSPLSSLVANGTISQSQSDSIKAEFKSRIHPSENSNEMNNQNIDSIGSSQSILETLENGQSQNASKQDQENEF